MAVYTDKIHLVADNLTELHNFAFEIGIHRRYYEGVRKGHPHYDIMNKHILDSVLRRGAKVVSRQELLMRSKNLLQLRNV